MIILKLLLLLALSDFIIWTLLILWAMQLLISIVAKLTNALGAVKLNELLVRIKLAEFAEQYPNIRGRKNAKLLLGWVLTKTFA